MSSTAKRPDGSWRARYRDASGREHSKHHARKVDAQRWLDEVTASVVTGMYVDPRAGKATVRQYAETWQAAQVHREATSRIVDNALRLHVLPVLGDRPMVAVTRTHVQQLVKALSARLSAGSVRNVYDVLAKVFAAAVDDRVVAVSPCRRIALPKVERDEVTPPTVDEVARLADAVGPRYRALVVLLAGSGLRIGEALGLDVEHVDFLRRTVRVERQRTQDGTLGPTKTPSSVRTVPLGQVVVDELAAHCAAYGGTGPLWTTELSKPLGYQTWKRVWASALQEVALDLDTHGLRHFTASALISGGASVKQVQAVLGHSSAAITLRVYSHLWPGDDDRTRSVMDTALGALADRVRTEDAV